jgi:hypothetical protein
MPNTATLSCPICGAKAEIYSRLTHTQEDCLYTLGQTVSSLEERVKTLEALISREKSLEASR